jgi:hypothetical protein
MPWGTCMLPMECEAEYRIYRGDYFCGRTQFICCGVLVTSYDMYQGFDVSFEDSNLLTDSEEKKYREIGSKERMRRQRLKNRKKRRRERMKRKRKIKRAIRKIETEIRKVLSKTFWNRTHQSKKKTKELKKFIKNLKVEYKMGLQSLKEIHMNEMVKIDNALQTKLEQIRGMNREFHANNTYREIIVNGTVNPKVVRMLVDAYPDLAKMVDGRKSNPQGNKPKDYDIEYGVLYY